MSTEQTTNSTTEEGFSAQRYNREVRTISGENGGGLMKDYWFKVESELLCNIR